MGSSRHRQALYATDQLVGLVFLSHDKWCHFRADCGLTFNAPLDRDRSYALTDPETEELAGILNPNGFTGAVDPIMYRIFLVRPLLVDL